MKKLVLIVALLLPLLVSAAATNFVATWDPYPAVTLNGVGVVPTVHVFCGVNVLDPSTEADVGNAAATANTTGVAFSLNVNPGDSVSCHAIAEYGTTSSPSSAEATLSVPLVLPAPVLHVRAAP